MQKCPVDYRFCHVCPLGRKAMEDTNYGIPMCKEEEERLDSKWLADWQRHAEEDRLFYQEEHRDSVVSLDELPLRVREAVLEDEDVLWA